MCNATNPVLPSPTEFSKLELTTDKIKNVLHSLDPNKASGLDGLPGYILKKCATQLVSSLGELYNRSLVSSQIPRDWKLAHIIPLYKKGEKARVENYRPISLWPIVAKILKCCMFNCLLIHVRSFIHDVQHGFVNGKSCST